MANLDWRDVYMEERHRPGYVLQNGKSQIKRAGNTARKLKIKPPIDGKGKAA